MRSYLQSLHTKSDSHKRAFALAVSGGFTLMLFTVWSFVHFGSTPTIATEEDQHNLAAVVSVTNDVTPFENVQSGIKNSFDALKAGFSNATNGNAVDLNGTE